MADPLVHESAPASISIVPDGSNFRTVTESQRYETMVLPWSSREKAPIWQLLDIRQRKVAVDGPDADFHYLEAEARIAVSNLGTTGKAVAAFTIAGQADEVTAYGGFLSLTRNGCCADQPTHAIYSLLSGKYLFHATGEGAFGEWIRIAAAGVVPQERYIAAHVRETVADAELFAAEPNGAAIITYADERQALQRLMLVIPAAAMADSVPHEWYAQLDLVDAAHPTGTRKVSIEPGATSGPIFFDATIRLRLDDATSVEIPLSGSRLQFEAARLPAGYRLMEIPL